MPINKINNKGFVTEKSNDRYAVIEDSVTFNSGVNFQGEVTSKYFAVMQGTSQQIFTGAYHSVMELDGSDQFINGGLGHLWNTSSFTFYPTEIGKIYSFRIVGLVESDTNADSFHIDFELSDVIPTQSVLSHGSASLHRQSADVFLSNKAGFHDHINLNGFIITDRDMVENGAKFYAATSGKPVTFKSGTLIIKTG